MVGKAGLPPLCRRLFRTFSECTPRCFFHDPQRHIRVPRCLPALLILRHLLNDMAVECRYFNINWPILRFHADSATLKCAAINLVTANAECRRLTKKKVQQLLTLVFATEH